MKQSVIDIGSNSVRLLLKDMDKSKKIIETTKLAKNMNGGVLDIDSVKRTTDAVRQLITMACELGYPPPLIFATEAVRAAKNKELFLSHLRSVTSLPIDILSGDDEAVVAFLGAKQCLGHNIHSSIGVIDIGGASVEYAYGTLDKILYKKSIPIGAIRLKSICGDEKPIIKAHVLSQLATLNALREPSVLIGIGGTITSLAAMDLNLQSYDPLKVHKHKLTLHSLLQLERIIFSDEPLLDIFKTLKPTRAEIIRQGITLVIELMLHLKVNELIVSETDNLEGYLQLKENLTN